MDDVRKPRRSAWKSIAPALVLAVPLFVWLPRGAELTYVVHNPNRTYRVEFYTARHWQRLLHPGMYEPGFVRLIDNCDPDRLTREGPVVEREGGGNSHVVWLEALNGRVGVGRDTHFTGVPPISADCKVLPVRGSRGGP